MQVKEFALRLSGPQKSSGRWIGEGNILKDFLALWFLLPYSCFFFIRFPTGPCKYRLYLAFFKDRLSQTIGFGCISCQETIAIPMPANCSKLSKVFKAFQQLSLSHRGNVQNSIFLHHYFRSSRSQKNGLSIIQKYELKQIYIYMHTWHLISVIH